MAPPGLGVLLRGALLHGLRGVRQRPGPGPLPGDEVEGGEVLEAVALVGGAAAEDEQLVAVDHDLVPVPGNNGIDVISRGT